MESFNQLFDFAIQIEENGMQFYQAGAKQTENETLKLLFNYLAEEETHHRQRFLQLKAESQRREIPGDPMQENLRFLNAFVHNVVFNEESVFNRDRLHTEHELLRFALQRESESLLYYEEVKKLLSPEAHSILDQIIGEEIEHYLKLSTLLDKM